MIEEEVSKVQLFITSSAAGNKCREEARDFCDIVYSLALAGRRFSIMKGRTIRKLSGGRRIFEPQEFFFVIKFLV